MIKTAGIINTEAIYLFDNFIVDRKLPKYATLPKTEKSKREAMLNSPEFQSLSHEARWGILSAMEEEDQDDNVGRGRIRAMPVSSFVMPGWRRKSGSGFFLNLYDKVIGKIREMKAEDVRDVFARVKMSTREIGEWLDRDDELRSAIDAARANGQTELEKSLKSEFDIRGLENALFVKGHKKYITESDLLDFAKKCEKGLAIDWISDFTRPIPASVTAKIKEMNELCIFDNYSILHFDPGNKAVSPKAVEKRKDPIVFGMIKDSRALYFVDDWEDEYCNLRFDQIVKSLGRDLELK